MQNHDEQRTSLGNRRRAERRESDAEVQVRVEPGTVTGHAENLSAAGVFFFSPDQVRVRIEVTEHGVSRTYTGRLVRVESLSPHTNGFAVEFDRA